MADHYHHHLHRPPGGIPDDPPLRHPQTFPIRLCTNNAAYRWALLNRPGSASVVTAEMLLALYKSAIVRKTIEYADDDTTRLKNVAKAVAGNDITVITGAHGSGKTSLIPFLAKSSSEAAESKGAAKTSEKFIVCTDANNGATLKLHYRKVYPQVNINLYLDNAASALGDQLIRANMSDHEKNTPLEPTKIAHGKQTATGMLNIPGIICSQHLGLELMKFGLIGTVFVENGECFHHHSAFTAVISKAIAKMLKPGEPGERRRIGRLVIITADRADSKIVKDFIDKLATAAEGKLKIGVASLDGGYPIQPATTLLFPDQYDSLAKQGFERADILQDLEDLITAMDERKLVMTPTDLNTAMRFKDSDEPDHLFLRKVVEVVSDHVLMAEVSRCKDAPLKELGTILITVASREAVQAIANGLLKKNAFYLHAQDGSKTPAFNTSRMSFEWKFDVGCFRDADVYIGIDYYKSPKGQKMKKGRVVIATPAVAEGLDIGPLRAAILCANRQTASTYKSCGLRAPRSHFVDSHAIKQIRSRLGRARPREGRFYFSGTPQLCEQLLGRVDERVSISNNNVAMGDFLQEFAPHDTSDHVVPIRHLPEGPLMMDDARKMGLVETDNTTNRSTVYAEVEALVKMFPKIHPQTAAIAVMGTRCGLAAHSIIAAAMEQADDRIYQQAATNNRNDTHTCYELPLVDLFKATVPFVPHGGGRMVQPPSYESERVAMIDLCASFVDAISFRCSDPEKLCVDFVRGAINPPNSNWWSGVWSGPRAWQMMAGTHPALINRANRQQSFGEIYQKLFKDEGREAFCQALREITKALHQMGLTPDEEDVIGGNNRAAYNRHLLCPGSPLLSPRGAKILSAILTMCSSNVAEHIGFRTIPNSLQDNKPAVLPPKYKVTDGVHYANGEDMKGKDVFIHVSGFGIPPKPTPADTKPKLMPHPKRRLAVYTRSTASPEPGRFHALMHPISVGQMAVLLNVFGSWKSFAEKDDGDNTKEGEGFALLQLNLTGSHCRRNDVTIRMRRDLWLAVRKARDYLKVVLNWALSGQNMDDYEKFLERTWDEYYLAD